MPLWLAKIKFLFEFSDTLDPDSAEASRDSNEYSEVVKNQSPSVREDPDDSDDTTEDGNVFMNFATKKPAEKRKSAPDFDQSRAKKTKEVEIIDLCDDD